MVAREGIVVGAMVVVAIVAAVVVVVVIAFELSQNVETQVVVAIALMGIAIVAFAKVAIVAIAELATVAIAGILARSGDTYRWWDHEQDCSPCCS